MIIAISGPSGVGKGSILGRLLKADDTIKYSISATTRSMRPLEEEGKSYFFKTPEEFDKMISNKEILEWDEYCGNKYGTPITALEQFLSEGKDVALDITLSGAKAIKEHFKEDAITVFLLPPSLYDLESRIRNRHSETEQQIKARMAAAKKELLSFGICDYVIVNEEIEVAVLELKKIIEAERNKSCRNKDILNRYKLI